MKFLRIDTVDDGGKPIVHYQLDEHPGYDLTFTTSGIGVSISGTSPVFTDFIAINQVLVWCQYQNQKLRETGQAIPQAILERGEL